MINKKITALIFTLNEERRIPFILDNLKDYCHVVVLDGGSTDGTEKICNENGITFIRRPEASPEDEMRLGVLQWSYDQVLTEYVMHVYCSHFYPPRLLTAFSDQIQDSTIDAVYHDVMIFRYGKIVHRPVFRRRSSACVFYKKSIITFDGSKIHDELAIIFNPNTMVRLKPTDELSLHIFQDEDYLSTEKKHLKYAKTEADQMFRADHKKIGIYDIFLAPFFKFGYYYFRSGAFMNGLPGLIYAIALFQYDLSKNTFLWEMQNSMATPQAIKSNDDLRRTLISQSKSAGI